MAEIPHVMPHDRENDVLTDDTVRSNRMRLYEAIARNPKDYAARRMLRETYAAAPSEHDIGGGALPHACPCCGHAVPIFLPGGPLLRPNACCPACESLERHRLIALYLRRLWQEGEPHSRSWNEQSSVVHVAPEPPLARMLAAAYGARYRSMDLMPRRQNAGSTYICADLCALPFAEGSVDMFLVSHVLEHVPDDRLAMREVHRVLSATGFGLLVVPMDVRSSHTVEAPPGATAQDRLRLFGQEDHLRLYGMDFGSRLADAGLAVHSFTCHAVADAQALGRYGLNDADIVYRVTR